MTQQADWASRLCQGIAAEVRKHRVQRKMSAQQLADRCAELGVPIARAVLANLENGRRNTISVAELLVLARALDVSPVSLLFGLGSVDAVEVLPGTQAGTWDAVRWATGESVFPGDALPETVQARSPIDRDLEVRATAARYDYTALFRVHDIAALEVLQALYDTDQLATTAARAESEHERSVYTRAVTSRNSEAETYAFRLQEMRTELRHRGIAPPQLPPSLAHLDPPENDEGASS